MGKLIEYIHHGVKVKVDEDLKGKHREHCLCHRCIKFHPQKKINCPIAEQNYKLCVEHNVVTPVYECREIIEGEPDYSACEF